MAYCGLITSFEPRYARLLRARQRPISFHQLASAGFYELQLASGRHDVVGVNPDRRESNLEVLPDDTLALWRGNSGEQSAQAGAAGGATQEQTQPYRLWWYIMLLVFAATIAESLLADRYLAAQQQEDL